MLFEEVLAADLARFGARVACPRGVCFYFDFDSANPDIFYGWADGWGCSSPRGLSHRLFTLLEALS